MEKDKDLLSASSSESFDEDKHPRDEGGKFASGGGAFKEADEFRYIERHENKKVQGHPAHVYAKNDEQAKYLQMTHSKFIKDMAEANIELKANPNSSDPDTAYVIPKSQIANLSDLGKIREGWKLSEIDNDTLIIYREEPFNKKR